MIKKINKKTQFRSIVINDLVKFYSGKVIFVIVCLLVFVVTLQAFGIEATVEEYEGNSNRIIDEEIEYLNEVLEGEYGISGVSIEYFRNQLKVYEYMRDNDIEPIKTHSIGNLVKSINSLFSIIVIIMIVASGKVISDEYSNETLISLVSKPVARFKLLLAKITTLISVCILIELLVAFFAIMIGGMFWGFDGLEQQVVFYNNGIHCKNVFEQALYYAFYNFYTLFGCGILTMTLTVVLKNGLIGTGISTAIYVLGSSMMVSLAKYDLFRYSFIANMQFNIYFEGEELFKGLTINDSVLNVLIHVLGFLIVMVLSFQYTNADE